MSERSVKIGGNVQGGVIIAGDNNKVGDVKTNITMPDPASVDIRKELAALREILARLETPDQNKIVRALDDAEEEAAKSEPDKDEVGEALQRVMKHAVKAQDFTKIVTMLQPPVVAASAWLGTNWHHILKVVGL